MKDLITRQNLMEKLESFLTRACEAEGANDHMEAERLFRMALYCEGNLVPKVTYVREYVNQAGPVYKQEQLAEPASNSRKSIMKQKRKTDSHALQSRIDCPRWLQKKMWTNLKMAKKDRVNRVRAKIAAVLLDSIIAKSNRRSPKISANQAR